MAEHPHAMGGCDDASSARALHLDPVTFEVLKNAFVTIVDQMAEQILRTCYSFVIYKRDFSRALYDRQRQLDHAGSYDIAVHVGTLHFTCKAVIDAFEDDMQPGDVFAINDPYAGGTHFSTCGWSARSSSTASSIAYAQSNGHWADVGGSVPGRSTSTARDTSREGIRVTPVRLWDQGALPDDVADLIVSNTRVPLDTGRHARPGRGDPGGGARDAAARRQIRHRHGGRGRSRRCRTTSSG